MNLNKKKMLASRTLNVGKGRIIFVNERMEEIKEAITKQDVRELVKAGAIRIREIKGRKTVQKRNRKRSFGKIKKKINRRKRTYMIITRKLRAYIKDLKDSGKITVEKYRALRIKIRNSEFKSLAQIKDHIKESK